MDKETKRMNVEFTLDIPKKEMSRYSETLAMTIVGVAVQENDRLKNILYNYVTPPINGEITKGKLRYRGISSIIRNQRGQLIGVRQRNHLITYNGEKVEFIDGCIKDKKILKRYFE